MSKNMVNRTFNSIITWLFRFKKIRNISDFFQSSLQIDTCISQFTVEQDIDDIVKDGSNLENMRNFAYDGLLNYNLTIFVKNSWDCLYVITILFFPTFVSKFICCMHNYHIYTRACMSAHMCEYPLCKMFFHKLHLQQQKFYNLGCFLKHFYISTQFQNLCVFFL